MSSSSSITVTMWMYGESRDLSLVQHVHYQYQNIRSIKTCVYECTQLLSIFLVTFCERITFSIIGNGCAHEMNAWRARPRNEINLFTLITC